MTAKSARRLEVEIIKTASLGNRGYLVHDGVHAIAIDVLRDYERWVEVASSKHVKITHVVETHMHNDYVTGGYRLAQKLGVEYLIPEHSDASFDAVEVGDGHEFTTGNLTIRVLHTPGHTPHHMSYIVSYGKDTALFTGGGVLYGTVGRPDLISKEMTHQLAEAQYDSAQKLLRSAPLESQVYPTHGFGSFCSSSPGTGADASTLADEKRTNIAYTSSDKNEFINTVISGLGAYPRYYSHMGSINRNGPGDMKLKAVEKLSAEKLKSMLSHDEWVVDIRTRKAYASHHPEHAAGFEMSDSFSTYIGWIIPWGDTITLVGDSKEELMAAQTQLGRIGMDEFVSHATDAIDAYLSSGAKRSFPIRTHVELHKVLKDENVLVLDVRNTNERDEIHIRNSIHIPLHEILGRLDDIPRDKTIWVHCASGYRASIAASLLDREGYSVVSIDDQIAKAKDVHDHTTLHVA